MEMSDYQNRTRDTATYPDAETYTREAINYTLVGLGGEVGEVLNKWKKVLRGDLVTADALDALADELGDCLWYLARAADELGYSLETIAEMNLRKLDSRKARGVLKGNGDGR